MHWLHTRLRWAVAALTAIAVTSGAGALANTQAPAETSLRIGIGRSLTAAEVQAAGGLQVIAGGTLLRQVEANQALTISLIEGRIQVSGLEGTTAGPIQIATHPTSTGQASYLRYKGREYRGIIEILVTAKEKRLSVVNIVTMEEYLRSVVAREMPCGWHPEALKAQAVASRSFARFNIGRFADEGFDLDDTTATQAYTGVTGECASASRAVEATRGQVLTANGRVANALYFSSSGGHTENNEIIYPTGSPLSYLRGVPDFDNLPNNPHFAWQHTFRLDEFAERLRSRVALDSIATVRPGPVIGVSGRPQRWIVADSAGRSVTLTGQEMRSALGLKSPPREMRVQITAAVVPDRQIETNSVIHVVGGDRVLRARSTVGTYVAGGSGGPVPTRGAVVTRAKSASTTEGTITVIGGGNGPGVGMSQWGAQGMALLQAKTYTEILAHFYRGTTLASP